MAKEMRIQVQAFNDLQRQKLALGLQVRTLKAQNAELLAALRKCVVLLDNLGGTFIARERAHRLIAKAERGEG